MDVFRSRWPALGRMCNPSSLHALAWARGRFFCIKLCTNKGVFVYEKHRRSQNYGDLTQILPDAGWSFCCNHGEHLGDVFVQCWQLDGGGLLMRSIDGRTTTGIWHRFSPEAGWSFCSNRGEHLGTQQFNPCLIEVLQRRGCVFFVYALLSTAL